MHTRKAVLSIAGSDSSGGAGIQADIKTISACGLFAETAVALLTAQNTEGIRETRAVDPDFIVCQIDAVFEDIRPAAVKIGALATVDAIRAIASALERWGAEHIVLDPVMVATSGSALNDEPTTEALREHLFPLAEIITPNIPEAEALCGFSIEDTDGMERAALALAAGTSAAVLVKGGHGIGDANDCLGSCSGGARWFYGKRIVTENTHGTGCTLSSAIACGLAEGLDPGEAIERAKHYVSGALAAGLALGRGSGPLEYMWELL